MTAPLLDVRGLRVAFPMGGGWGEAVRGVDFAVAPGEAVGLVGESGSGKSLSALAIMRLIAAPGRIAGGIIRFDGQDLLALPESGMRRLRGRHIGMVFQDPSTSLNPAFSVGQQLVDTIRAHRPELGRKALRDRAAEVLSLVGITEPQRRLTAYPHQFSGGMRQRVLIAMAIACEPRLLIADEPTTALDVTVQARVVELLNRLRQQLGLTVLFISHNLDLVAELCDRVVVMYAGQVVEEAATVDLFTHPRHPYTRLLQRCIPRLGLAGHRLPAIEGAPPPAGRVPPGCAFAERCPDAVQRCALAPPARRALDGHDVACWEAA
ncbi:ABC transporter ATP-binding protein [Roseomonas sp. HJA6]|uniref:ABC transporter ATP-binding protein n=1 Tax=Roseomonas alba TaxID=2846776 RepID=A0ABS7ADL2_9PROT|nr:ABC transporter ATP-binding protein [Neoroseomonas alba]MBW6399259.1 ABC transporter ATP-binding protein [Neoroseomonas alba]